jgi:precorrin-2/cobalt-factor-2 C20-methyltransferase
MSGARGRLYGLGVGPGDPELLTLKALRLLQAAPVIAYPAPERGHSLARSIVASWLKGHQQEIPIRFPMRSGPPPVSIYDNAAVALAAELDRGRDVAWLCQGDPFVYGSFINIFARLAGRYQMEVVAGVSSLTAAAAVAGLPLVSHDETLTIIPATLNRDIIMARLSGADVAVIVKIGRHLEKIRRVLDQLGLLDCAIFVEHATLPTQRVAPVACINRGDVPYFSIALVRCRGLAPLPRE